MYNRNVITANIATEVEIFADEQHLYHLLLNKRENDPVKKEYYDQNIVQSFTAADFRQMEASGFFKMYDSVVILHDPTKVGKIDKGTFYTEADAPIGDDVSADLKEQAAAQGKVTKNSTKKANKPADDASTVTGTVSPPAANDSIGANTTTKTEHVDFTDIEAARAEFKRLYEAEPDATVPLQELNEMIAAKKLFS